MAVHLVVGANRGIGLGLVQQLRARGERVIATCRGDAGQLARLDGVEVISGVDITSDDAVSAFAAQVPTIDVLWVVAGVLERTTLRDPQPQVCQRLIDVNAIGPLRVVSALQDRLAQGGTVALVTSRMGSVSDNTSGGSYAYRMSKAALNAAGKSMAIDLAEQRVTVLLLHPGWVRTDMTSGRGLVDVSESVAGLIARVDQLGFEASGSFWHMNGDPLPW